MGRKSKHGKKNAESQTAQTGNNVNEINGDVSVKISEIYGRYLETAKDFKAGSLIFSDKFLVAGPMRLSNIVCVGCYADLDYASNQQSHNWCPRCSWPVCSEKCSTSIFHSNECRSFNCEAPKFDTFENGHFGALTVFRGLLLKLTKSEAWKTLLTLEHHNEARKVKPIWKENEDTVLKVLKETWNLCDLFTDQEIHTVCGILEVNAFELGEQHSYRAVFPTAAMMAHNCVPNVTHFENSESGVIEVRATVDIPAGSTLFFSYAYALQGTESRKQALAQTKFFDCNCDRCKDPTELGSHLSTLICQKCSTGHVLHQNTVEKAGVWSCTNRKCNAITSDQDLEKMYQEFESNLETLSDVPSKERILQRCSRYFHPNHFIPIGIKYSLAQIYGHETGLHELSQTDLERKSALCSEVLKVLDILTPGINMIRGVILHEYQATELTLARRIYETRKYSVALLKRRLANAMKMLKETISIFEFADPSSPEHRIAQISKSETLPGLEQWIRSLR